MKTCLDCTVLPPFSIQLCPLHAAAPDLLAALQAFLRAPSSGSAGPGSVTIEVQTFNLNAARAALAKARPVSAPASEPVEGEAS